jgi:hypothetical protein
MRDCVNVHTYRNKGILSKKSKIVLNHRKFWAIRAAGCKEQLNLKHWHSYRRWFVMFVKVSVRIQRLMLFPVWECDIHILYGAFLSTFCLRFLNKNNKDDSNGVGLLSSRRSVPCKPNCSVSFSHNIPWSETLTTMARQCNIHESVHTHACPRRGLIPESMRQVRKHHALMTMPTAVGLIQNNNKIMTRKLC